MQEDGTNAFMKDEAERQRDRERKREREREKEKEKEREIYRLLLSEL